MADILSIVITLSFVSYSKGKKFLPLIIVTGDIFSKSSVLTSPKAKYGLLSFIIWNLSSILAATPLNLFEAFNIFTVSKVK